MELLPLLMVSLGEILLFNFTHITWKLLNIVTIFTLDFMILFLI